MDVISFASNPGRMAAWADWSKSELGKELKAMLQAYARPVGMTKPQAETALYAHGVQVGYTMLMDLLFNLDLTAEGLKQKLEMEETMVPDYGAGDELAKIQASFQVARAELDAAENKQGDK